MIDYTKLRKSLKHLEVQHVNLERLSERPELTALDREAVAESVIQRFETCYDSLWKVLKRYLIEEAGVAEVLNSPKAVLRLAGQNGLLSGSVEKWIEYANARTDTAHDYSAEKATQVIALMAEFIRDAVLLYERMSGEQWG